MNDTYSRERVIVVYTADSMTEAMVVRGLLESAGIRSPGSESSDPFPMCEPPKGGRGVEIYAIESQADEARNIIEEYLNAGGDEIGGENDSESS